MKLTMLKTAGKPAVSHKICSEELVEVVPAT
jgi:hypothetical protein